MASEDENEPCKNDERLEETIDGVQEKLPRGVVKEIMLERILLVTNFSRNRERCRKLSL